MPLEKFSHDSSSCIHPVSESAIRITIIKRLYRFNKAKEYFSPLPPLREKRNPGKRIMKTAVSDINAIVKKLMNNPA